MEFDIFRKKIKLSKEQQKELDTIETTAYLEKAKELAKTKGRESAEREYKVI